MNAQNAQSGFTGCDAVRNKRENPDDLYAGRECIYPRETIKKVYCQKLETSVKDLGDKVLRIEGFQNHIGKVA